MDAAILVVGDELAHLQAISPAERVPYTWFAEVSAIEVSPEPAAFGQQRYSFGLNQGDLRIVRFGFTRTIAGSGQ
jgi:hypothetical protein